MSSVNTWAGRVASQLPRKSLGFNRLLRGMQAVGSSGVTRRRECCVPNLAANVPIERHLAVTKCTVVIAGLDVASLPVATLCVRGL